STAVARARHGDGPTLLELDVPRLVPHSSQDDDNYRSAAELEDLARQDPLPRLRARLADLGVLDDDADAALWEEIRAWVREDTERAAGRREPEVGRARRWLFAGDPPHVGHSAAERP